MEKEVIDELHDEDLTDDLEDPTSSFPGTFPYAGKTIIPNTKKQLANITPNSYTRTLESFKELLTFTTLEEKKPLGEKVDPL